MTIYKVRGFVHRTISRGWNRGSLERVYYGENVIIDNLESARAIYKSTLREVKSWTDLWGYSGKAELFIPHLHTDCTLAYWPDNDEYIEQYDSNKEREK